MNELFYKGNEFLERRKGQIIRIIDEIDEKSNENAENADFEQKEHEIIRLLGIIKDNCSEDDIYHILSEICDYWEKFPISETIYYHAINQQSQFFYYLQNYERQSIRISSLIIIIYLLGSSFQSVKNSFECDGLQTLVCVIAECSNDPIILMLCLKAISIYPFLPEIREIFEDEGLITTISNASLTCVDVGVFLAFSQFTNIVLSFIESISPSFVIQSMTLLEMSQEFFIISKNHAYELQKNCLYGFHSFSIHSKERSNMLLENGMIELLFSELFSYMDSKNKSLSFELVSVLLESKSEESDVIDYLMEIPYERVVDSINGDPKLSTSAVELLFSVITRFESFVYTLYDCGVVNAVTKQFIVGNYSTKLCLMKFIFEILNNTHNEECLEKIITSDLVETIESMYYSDCTDISDLSFILMQKIFLLTKRPDIQMIILPHIQCDSS